VASSVVSVGTTVAEVDDMAILALSFDSQVVAQQALIAALGLQDDETLVVHDAVLLSGEREGSAEVVASMDPTAVAAAVPCTLVGAIVGALVAGPIGLLVGGALAGGSGALLAKIADTGIPNQVVDELREQVHRGETVLALLVSERQDGAVTAFAMRCGTIGRSTILPYL
jgi:uncharacterized membrane protein